MDVNGITNLCSNFNILDIFCDIGCFFNDCVSNTLLRLALDIFITMIAGKAAPVKGLAGYFVLCQAVVQSRNKRAINIIFALF